MHRRLLFAGLVLVGLAEAWWAKTYFADSVFYASLLLFGAAGAWIAASGGVSGLLILAFTHTLFVGGWVLEGTVGMDLVVAVALAAGFCLAAWATFRARPHLIAAGFALAGVVQTWWTVDNANLAFQGFFLGNVLFTIGALLAAAGAWRPPEPPVA